MDQQLHFLTLATPDLDASRSFSCDGLGWKAAHDVPGEIIFLQIAHNPDWRVDDDGTVRIG